LYEASCATSSEHVVFSCLVVSEASSTSFNLELLDATCELTDLKGGPMAGVKRGEIGPTFSGVKRIEYDGMWGFFVGTIYQN